MRKGWQRCWFDPTRCFPPHCLDCVLCLFDFGEEELHETLVVVVVVMLRCITCYHTVIFINQVKDKGVRGWTVLQFPHPAVSMVPGSDYSVAFLILKKS